MNWYAFCIAAFFYDSLRTRNIVQYTQYTYVQHTYMCEALPLLHTYDI